MLLLGLALLSGVAKTESAPNRRILGGDPDSSGGSVKDFDVTKYGAKGDGKSSLLVRIPFLSRDRNSAQTGSMEKENYYLYN